MTSHTNVADSQSKLERPKSDPQALTPEYHKARKQLMLWAGILFIWELVGIDLEKAKESGGNAGAIITAVKSPQAVPWVLLVLVAYFLFKLWVEWNQCGSRRREMVHARIDYKSAWTVAFLACSLYAYQALGRIQFADLLQRSSGVRSVVLGMMAGMGGGLLGYSEIRSYKLIRSYKRDNRGRIYGIVMVGGELVALLFVLFSLLRSGFLSVKFTALGLLVGLALCALILRRLKTSRVRKVGIEQIS